MPPDFDEELSKAEAEHERIQERLQRRIDRLENKLIWLGARVASTLGTRGPQTLRRASAILWGIYKGKVSSDIRSEAEAIGREIGRLETQLGREPRFDPETGRPVKPIDLFP